MCGSCDNVSMIEWRRNDPGRDQSADMSHVNEQVGAAEIGNLSHAFVVNQAAIGGGTGNENFGSVHDGVVF